MCTIHIIEDKIPNVYIFFVMSNRFIPILNLPVERSCRHPNVFTSQSLDSQKKLNTILCGHQVFE